MQKRTFNVLKSSKNERIISYCTEEKEGFAFNCNNKKFLCYYEGGLSIICDAMCGVAIIKTNGDFTKAKEELKKRFQKYLKLLKTEDYRILCEVFKNANTYCQCRYDI